LESAYGVPTAPITTARFADYIRRDLNTYGMDLPFSFSPYPVVGMAAATLRQYVEGNDPITGKPLMEEVVDALTRQGSAAGRKGEKREASGPRLLKADTEERLRLYFLEKGWTDGLPIILPTEERVAAMLEGTSRAPGEVVGAMSISDSVAPQVYTVEKVAVNAVMAGAGPQHLPTILALASARHPAFPSSTTSFATMAVVNGPVRKELRMNSGVGALSPLNYANSVIGRAWTLMTINFGNTRVGETFLGSQGNNLNYNNMCFAENEERSVWDPFHVEKGFGADESVVSIFRGWSVLNSMGCVNQRPPQVETAILMKAFSGLRSAATLILDPMVAKNLKEIQGFDTKADYTRWLSGNVKVPAGEYWAADIIYSFMLPLALEGIEPYASWSSLPDDELLTPFNDPKNINIVVMGGETNAFWKTTDFGYVASVSVDEWR
jgi:hypothetical protein